MVVGVTVIVPVIGSFPLLTAMKDGILVPVPDAAKPIAGLELVQPSVTVPGLTIRLRIGTILPSYTMVSVFTFTLGIALISILNVVPVAHKPDEGVKVYTPLPVLLTVAGLHIPVIPLVEVVGNTGTVLLIQTD